jgi:hypothetical protein
MVYLVESCAEADGFDSTGLPILWIIHRHENARELGRARLATALEMGSKERSASEGGPYTDWMLQIVWFRPDFVGLAF